MLSFNTPSKRRSNPRIRQFHSFHSFCFNLKIFEMYFFSIMEFKMFYFSLILTSSKISNILSRLESSFRRDCKFSSEYIPNEYFDTLLILPIQLDIQQKVAQWSLIVDWRTPVKKFFEKININIVKTCCWSWGEPGWYNNEGSIVFRNKKKHGKTQLNSCSSS